MRHIGASLQYILNSERKVLPIRIQFWEFEQDSRTCKNIGTNIDAFYLDMDAKHGTN